MTYLHTGYLNIDISSGSGRNNERKILFRKNELFVEVLAIMQRNVLKVQESIKKHIVRLVIWTDNGLNLHLTNVLDLDMNIT